MKRYYQFDEDGYVVGSFARPQSGLTLELLEETDPKVKYREPDPMLALDQPAVRALIQAIDDGTVPVGQTLGMDEIKRRVRGKIPVSEVRIR